MGDLIDLTLLLKIALGLAGLVGLVVLYHWPPLRTISNRQFTGLALLFAATTRLGTFVLLYLVLGVETRSDVPGFYRPQALHVFEGQVPYRDFEWHYGPLFCYLLAGVLWVWDSARAIVLATILLELLSLPVWLSVGRRLFTERTARLACLFYLTNPTVFQVSVIAGQNQLWFSLHLAVALWLLLRGRAFASGLVLGLSLLTVKFLILLFAPPLSLGARRMFLWVAGFLVLPVLAYGGLLLAGIDILAPVRIVNGDISSGNLPFLLSLAGLDSRHGTTGTVFQGVLLLALAVVFLAAAARGAGQQLQQAVHLTTLVFLTFIMLSKLAYTNYQALCMFLLCLTIAEAAPSRRGVLAFGLFGLLSTVEPTLWHRWFNGPNLGLLWQPEQADGPAPWQILTLAAWDMGLLTCYAGYWWLSFRQVFASRQWSTANRP